MNWAQRIVLLIGLMLLGTVVLYPPWMRYYLLPADTMMPWSVDAGRHLLFAPPPDGREPLAPGLGSMPCTYKVIVERVFLDAGLVSIVTAGLIALLHKRRSARDRSPTEPQRDCAE